MSKKKKIVAGAGAAVIILAGAAFFLGSRGSAGTGGHGGPGGMGSPGGMQQESNVTVVNAANPTTGDVSVTSSLTGTVEAADVVYVYAKAGGDVTAVNVKAGDIVSQGQVLMEINTEQVESAKNNMDSAQVNLSQAQSNLNRMQILYGSGDLSDQEYEQYQNNLKSAELQYESAKLQYEKQVEYSTISAPIAGRVESVDVDVYDRVNQSAQLCVIAGEGQNSITFYVTQRMMQNLKTGDELEISKNGTTYTGNITEISNMVDASTGLFKVKGDMTGSDEIAIGSTVKIELVTERAENAMLVPVDAIYYSGGNAYVYLYEDGKAKMTSVEVGIYDSENAQILSGLNADDMVVSTWSSNLYEGADIRLKSEVEASGAAGGAPAEAGNADGQKPGAADAGKDGQKPGAAETGGEKQDAEAAPADQDGQNPEQAGNAGSENQAAAPANGNSQGGAPKAQ
ncbi:efflux RND transporter periplasmic adaptor subunit [Clostridium sp. AM42-4]|nr:efflux RND transporter periplasmic adaptor subunit [Clostridium sp. AM42-4]RHS87383.1 efflux RND transporter periplasmic adaptor subunit [Clostridium sp. AM42-4]